MEDDDGKPIGPMSSWFEDAEVTPHDVTRSPHLGPIDNLIKDGLTPAQRAYAMAPQHGPAFLEIRLTDHLIPTTPEQIERIRHEFRNMPLIIAPRDSMQGGYITDAEMLENNRQALHALQKLQTKYQGLADIAATYFASTDEMFVDQVLQLLIDEAGHTPESWRHKCMLLHGDVPKPDPRVAIPKPLTIEQKHQRIADCLDEIRALNHELEGDYFDKLEGEYERGRHD
jgi:hypothetical protein